VKNFLKFDHSTPRMFTSMKYPLFWKVVTMVLSNACFTPALAAPAKPVSGSGYIVKNGDTFAKIARSHGVPLAELLKANQLSNPDRILLGQRIVIPGNTPPKARLVPEGKIAAKPASKKPAAPASKTEAPDKNRESDSTTVNITPPPPAAGSLYVVQSGDTLSRIQRRTGSSISSLCKANGISETTILRPGQKLRLASGAAIASARPAPAKARPEPRQENLPAAQPVITQPETPRIHEPAIKEEHPLPPLSAQPVASTTAPHRIEKGETFSSVGRLYGVSQAKLVAANPGVNPAKLRIGQTLTIPGQPVRPEAQPLVVRADGRILASRQDPLGAGVTESGPAPAAQTRTGYLVEEGETLTQIAQRFHTTESELRRLNRLGDSDNIYAGRYILVPFIRQAPGGNILARGDS
jgi:peptidoglycan endopeptidase LytF